MPSFAELTYVVEPHCQTDHFRQAQATSIKILNMSDKNVDYPVACQCIGSSTYSYS